MSKKRIILLTVITLILLSASLLAGGLVSSELARRSANRSEATPTQELAAPIKSIDESSKNHTPGMYMAYDQDAYAAHAEQRRVLFFHAPWCPQCIALDKDISASDLPDDVAFFKVDYDSNQDLRKKYGVTLQTTLVLVDAQGNQVKKYTAYSTPNYASVKTNLLD